MRIANNILSMTETKLPLILASASPRRKELLELAGIPLEVIPSRADESFLPGELPEEHVRRVARAKAMDVGRQHPGRWVLGADTVVAIDGKVLGKPGGLPEAEKMLRELSRREHRVLTGFCILRDPSLEVREGIIISRVKFKPLSEEEIRWYINTGEPFDKAGGYAIQGKAAFMVEEVHGSYTNVVGLPLCEVVEILRELGAVDLFGTQMNADFKD
jgi:septum formation protein